MSKRAYVSRFTATMGLTPGYGHNNEGAKTVEDVVALWEKHSLWVRYNGMLYPSATITPSKAVYPVDAGCPIEGEDIVVIVGTNHREDRSDEMWRGSVTEVLGLVAADLNQITWTVAFDVVESIYYKRRES